MEEERRLHEPKNTSKNVLTYLVVYYLVHKVSVLVFDKTMFEAVNI